ncbi:MAG: hypothetical protein R3A12_02675 [Ignavibacteria bacterium]
MKENYVKLITENYSGKEKISFNAKSIIVCTNAFTEKFCRLNIKPGRGQVIITKLIKGLKFKVYFILMKVFIISETSVRGLYSEEEGGYWILRRKTSEFESNEIILKDLKNKLDDVILPGMEYEVDYEQFRL